MMDTNERFRKFVAYAWGTLIRPGSTFERLQNEPGAVAYGSFAVLLVGALYTGSQYIGYLNGFGACWQPFLPFPAEKYYFYQTFFTIPVFWLTTLVYAAVVQYFSSFFGGKGKFEHSMAVAAFGFHVTMLPLMFLPETIYFIFNIHAPMPGLELCGTLGLGLAADNIRLGLAVLWQLVVVTIGLQKVQKFSWSKALLIGLIGAIIYEAVFWTYIR